MSTPDKKLLNIVAQAIYDKKGFNTLALDIKRLSTLTDAVIIAEGNVERHVISLAKGIMEELKERGETPAHVEGLENGDWVVLDYGDVMIHLFMPSMRRKYGLEELFRESEIIDLEIDTSSPVQMM